MGRVVDRWGLLLGAALLLGQVLDPLEHHRLAAVELDADEPLESCMPSSEMVVGEDLVAALPVDSGLYSCPAYFGQLVWSYLAALEPTCLWDGELQAAPRLRAAARR